MSSKPRVAYFYDGVCLILFLSISFGQPRCVFLIGNHILGVVFIRLRRRQPRLGTTILALVILISLIESECVTICFSTTMSMKKWMSTGLLQQQNKNSQNFMLMTTSNFCR